MRAPLAPPRLSLPRNVDADAQAVETSSETDRPEARICCFSAATSSAPIELVVGRRHRVLPDQRLGRDLRAEVALDRAHVAVGQLEPGAGERVRELVRVLLEAARDRLVDRVEAQREVGRQHRRRAPLGAVVRVRDGDRRAVLRLPTGCAPAGLLRQLPLVAEEVLEEAVAPLRRRRGPGDLEAAGDRVRALAGAEACSSSRGPAPRSARPRARAPTYSSGSAAPWVLPNVWPPAISATVSSSFIAIRPNVSRMSRAAASGSGLPFGPSGLT